MKHFWAKKLEEINIKQTHFPLVIDESGGRKAEVGDAGGADALFELLAKGMEEALCYC